MRNETKEWLVAIAEVVAFFVLCGIIGRMEFDWESEKTNMPTWEDMR